MKTRSVVVCLTLVLTLSIPVALAQYTADKAHGTGSDGSIFGSASLGGDGVGVTPNPSSAKYVIFMVPDGMGLADVTAARILLNGPDGDRLNLETLDYIGYQRTHAANSTVTDSAAAASAWACGEKFNNREVSCHSDQSLPREERSCVGDTAPTALEVAASKGMATGLVATSQISHATPASFGSHVHTRYCGSEIARQYIEETGVDVVLGGGVYKTSSSDNCQQYGASYDMDQDDIALLAEENGYAVVGTRSQLTDAVNDGLDRVFGMFRPYLSGKTPELFRMNPYVEDDYADYPADEPTLPEITAAALDILEADKDGFFLVVEGSQIDWANHGNDINYQLGEMLAFDDAVGEVLDWIDEKPSRRNHTLLIIVADHETAGFAINGPYGTLSEAGTIVEAGWTSGGHTAVDTLIWAQGPQAHRIGKAVDNTDLYQIILDALD